MDISTPAARERALQSIPPRDAAQHHPILKAIFQKEVEYHRAEEDFTYGENIYCCAFLLYCVGKREDIPDLWAAKQINMDLASGFDIQFLVGAGVDASLDYLHTIGLDEAAQYINKCQVCGDFDDLQAWFEHQQAYFYGEPVNPDKKS